jgi:hypothetical protein
MYVRKAGFIANRNSILVVLRQGRAEWSFDTARQEERKPARIFAVQVHLQGVRSYSGWLKVLVVL